LAKPNIPARSRRASGAPAGRKRSLSREQVIEAALEVIDNEGPQGLSLHKVAARLAVYPTTIYTYFETVDGLRDAAQSSLMQQLSLPSADDATPIREQVIRYFESVRRLYVRHPGFMKVEIGSTTWIAGLRHLDRILEALKAAGVELERAWLIFRIGEGLAITSAMLARATRDPDYVAAQKEALQRYQGNDLPAVRRMLELTSANLSPDAGFHWLLDQALEGLLPSPPRRTARGTARPRGPRT
jgi:AcrR family transcriptional regulator